MSDILHEGLRPFELYSAKSLKMLDSWERQDAAAGFKTGFVALDEYIRLVPGEMTVAAARPGMGKTSLFMQIAGNICPNPGSGERVAIFSAEMAGWSLNMRLACAVSEVSMFKLRSGKADAADYEATRRAIQGIRKLPLLIDDRSRPSVEHMKEEIARMSEVYTLHAVMFDFLELLDAKGRGEEERISNAVVSLKEVAKEFDLPVLVISHLNRSIEDRGDKFPHLSDLRYSGMIEQIADQVLLMTRPKYYLDKGMNVDMKPYENLTGEGPATSNVQDIAYISIAKNRNGATGIIRLGFDGPNMRFYDLRRYSLPQSRNFDAMSASLPPEREDENDE
jgi:replicative DNA helicase